MLYFEFAAQPFHDYFLDELGSASEEAVQEFGEGFWIFWDALPPKPFRVSKVIVDDLLSAFTQGGF